MKAKFVLTLAVAAVLAVAVLACSALKGGEEEKTSTTPAPGPVKTTAPEAGKVTKTSVGDTVTLKGVLRGPNDSNKFDIFAESTYIEVDFEYPSDATYYVKVLGKTGNELGEFDLDEGDIIELTGGGKFTLIVHSISGDGPWSATYTD